MLTFVYEVTSATDAGDDDVTTSALGAASRADQEFCGVVAVDEAGWVVWYYQSSYSRNGGLPQVWDFLPASQNYSMVLLEVGFDEASRSDSP